MSSYGAFPMYTPDQFNTSALTGGAGAGSYAAPAAVPNYGYSYDQPVTAMSSSLASGGGAGGLSMPNLNLGSAGGAGGFLGSGMNGFQVAGAGLQGLQSLANIWMGFKAMSLAKKQFNFQKDYANANLANSMKTYNTALADRSRSRGFTEGQSQAQIDSYTKDNSLSSKTLGG